MNYLDPPDDHWTNYDAPELGENDSLLDMVERMQDWEDEHGCEITTAAYQQLQKQAAEAEVAAFIGARR